MRKLPRKTSTLILLASLFLFFSYYTPVPEEFNGKVNSFYSKRLSELKKEISNIRMLCRERKEKALLQKQFVFARKLYKKAAVLIEYFNPYEAKFINGPNLKRIESETPDNIIQPSGFQVIEDLIYGNNKPDYDKIAAQTDIMVKYIERIETEAGRINKFKEDLVFNSLQSQLISIIALGITGYDSPVAFHSIEEASSSFEGIRLLLANFKNDIEKINPSLYKRLNSKVSDCKQYLALHPGFNSFDRIKFITAYINPLAELLTSTGKKLNLVSFLPNRPLNGTAATIFSDSAFNVDFFSPGAPYEKNLKRIQLGKQLFSDPILSGNKKRAAPVVINQKKPLQMD